MMLLGVAGGVVPGDLADYFANVGATRNFYGLATYPAVIHDSTGITRAFFEAWSGSKRVMRTISYDHSSGLFGQMRGLMIGALTNDEHGVPSGCEDHQGYIHVFGSSHSSALYHVVSDAAVSSDADPTYSISGTLGTAYSYPKPVAVNSGITLLARTYTGGSNYPAIIRKTTALSGGVATWGSETSWVDFGASSRAYLGNTVLRSGIIHVVAAMSDGGDTYRKGVYYFKIDPATFSISNFDGSTTVAIGSLPINLATADANFRVYDHGSNSGQIPSLGFDVSGNPHILFNDGSGSSWTLKHIYHNGTSWSSPLSVSTVANRYGRGGISPLPGGDVELHYGDANHDWKMRLWSAGSLGTAQTILANGGDPLSEMTCPPSANDDLRVFATESAANESDVLAGGLRFYGYGDSGLIGPSNVVLDSSASAVISAFSTTPDVERQLAINDLIVRLKADGIWSKLDALYLLAAHESAAALVNWKNPGTFDITVVDAPVFTADSGYATDGVNDYLNTNFNPATAGGNYTQNSACFGFWSGTSGQSNTSRAGWFDGTDGVTMVPRNTSDRFQFRINQAAISESAISAVADGAGLYIANRSGASAVQGYRNGSQLFTAANASTALNSTNLRLGSITAISFAAQTFRAATIGGSLTSTEQAKLYAAMLNYLQQVGAV